MDDIPSKKGVSVLLLIAFFAIIVPSSRLSEVDYSYIDDYPLVDIPARQIKVQDPVKYNVNTISIIRSVFPPHLQDKAIEVAFCESSYKASAHGDKHLTFTDPKYGEQIGDSIGLFQIRTGGKNPNGTIWNRARANGLTADQFRAWMFDPTENAKYALTIYNRYGWGMWTCSGAK